MLDDLTNLQTLLKDPALLATKGYLAGDWCDGDDGLTFPVYNPARGDVVANVADISRTQTAKAISIAEKAQKEWAGKPAKERSNLMRVWYDMMMENQEDLATILTAEQGKPFDEAKGEIAYRPAAETPLSALAMGILADRAGIPKGVLSVIPSSRSSDIGKEFCENPIIRKLTFTGSTEVGRILLKQASEQIMKCSMELGGNAPFIVFDDADIDAAVEGAIMCKFRNNGQTCVCANRIYVQSGVYKEFAKKLSLAVSKMKVGDGFANGTALGPLINSEAIEKVQEHIADAKSKGANVILGGETIQGPGNFLTPTIVTQATKEMLVSRRNIWSICASF